MTKKRKTEAESPVIDDLTIKQNCFFAEYIRSGNASEAYRLSYDCENMSEESINKEAFRLLQHPKIAPLVLAYKEKVANKAVLDRAWVLERLMRNARIAMGEETVKLKLKGKGDELPMEVEMSMRDAAAANKSLELLGKTSELRMWVEQVEHGAPNEFDNMTTDDLRRYIADQARALGIREPAKGNGKLN